jgi:transmembrane sensor
MKIDYTIIKKYLEGEATLDEGALIENWFNRIEHENEMREKSFQYWEELKTEPDIVEYDESLLLGKIYREVKIKESKLKKRSPNITRYINIVMRIAAVLFVPLLIWHIINPRNLIAHNSELSYTEIYSPLGSRTIFYLPDGSKGWLSGGSYLQYPERFPGKTREVKLRGEAFFDVKTNEKKPFVVLSKNLNIIAKGTSFNVSAWDDAAETEIVLKEGKVDVFNNDALTQKWIASLKPGELLNVREKKECSIIKVDVSKYTSWTEGKLIFRDDPFAEVVKRINRWYNVNLIIKDPTLESYRYVATFQDETLDEVLNMLTLSAPIRYKKVPRKQLQDGTFEKRVVELYFKQSIKNKQMSNPKT